MLQRTLILAAISAAFAQVPLTPCQNITYGLKRELKKEDPHTFPKISDFYYIRDNISYTFDFLNLIFKGFSNVECNSFHVFGQDSEATLNLTGHNLEFNTSHAKIQTNKPVEVHPLTTNLLSKLNDYTLELWFKHENYNDRPFNLCILRDTLQITFYAEKILTLTGIGGQVAHELNNNTYAVVKAINHYLPRVANDITTKLNHILCQASINRRVPIRHLPYAVATPGLRGVAVRHPFVPDLSGL
ncbi:uncharacterized protein [Palaemon carinicauda]|uniref:uncharacterized protein n=1 Tax=Palaemon carinicauda TaxID=392227 RepID=UPI0035B65652